MGIPVLVLGASGSGKSTAMRNFTPDDVGVFNVASKPLPFRGKLPVINKATYSTILTALHKPSKKSYVIDDSQYLLAFEFFDRAKENGYGKFTDIALNFRNLINYIITVVPDDIIVYFLHHTEETADGTLKAKTIGKMLDEKLTLEGLFSIVLLARAEKNRYCFVTQSEGYSTAKSPMDMFPAEIDNDLKLVDDTIREYWGIPKTEAKPKKNSKEEVTE
jgi:hypothetical protein